LLDAVVTFHDSLPKPGEVIVYDIRIDEFFRQGETYLFRFRFAGTVNGKPFLTMRNGCAGFFTEAELASGKGIIHTALDLRPQEGRRPSDWREWVLLREESLDETQVDALREGDLVAAFGEQFKSTHLDSPMRLPGGMLRLVHRVSRILPQGGRFGLGQIRAEYDLRPDDWFLTCHFVDDQVMPGTLMYECCLHTLRIFLMRLGWVGEANEVICEPVREVASRLKCRGQVIASTQRVTYEVTVKELGYQPNAFAIADALMFADGKPIVEIQNMSLQMTGLTREKLERIWGSGQVLFPRERITAFAIGNPSEAFGEPYRVFDTERQIARLPGPPYQFLDRIVSIRAEAWKLQPGGEIIAEYDVPPEEWYFVANRSERMPFSVLLEIALQPCGWLAAYLGSALTTHEDLSFRNLGGKATQFLPVTPNIGVLRTWVKMTKVSTSVGMIIQHFDYEMTSRKGVVYRGDTYFGFFSKPALAQQIGMPKAPWWIPSQSAQLTGSDEKLPSDSPFPDTMMRMIDRINWYLPDGGDAGLGAIEGTIRVDPSMWFFAAHFYQDPVWPGSLGLESFLQLLKLLAFKRWGPPEPGWVWQTVALNKPHEWIYRGQVIPSDTEVTVQAQITRWDDQNRQLWANGFLRVDGRIIYEMKEFSLELVSIVS
jgi:3-hydroxymyristoyl/3-hydroxydecanoyl-(acyl carrier protein) dehydratase